MRPSAPSSAAGTFLRPALTATMQCDNGNSKIVISYGGLKGGEGFLTNPARCVQAFARLGQPDGISPSRMAEMLEVDKAGPIVRC
jgi:hypothetical protein